MSIPHLMSHILHLTSQMSTYAYRWADGTVSVCSARNKTAAGLLFDRIAPISRKLIVRLKCDLLMTVRPDIDQHWLLDEDGLDGGLDLELQERCYPRYNRTYWQIMDELQEGEEFLSSHPELRRKIETALERDINHTQKRIDKTPETPTIVLLYPKGLPGQDN